MIQLAGSEPNSDAVALFPEAARANRSVFYDRQGNARTIAETLEKQGRIQLKRAAGPLMRANG